LRRAVLWSFDPGGSRYVVADARQGVARDGRIRMRRLLACVLAVVALSLAAAGTAVAGPQPG
jgi:hypothetical protein